MKTDIEEQSQKNSDAGLFIVVNFLFTVSMAQGTLNKVLCSKNRKILIRAKEKYTSNFS